MGEKPTQRRFRGPETPAVPSDDDSGESRFPRILISWTEAEEPPYTVSPEPPVIRVLLSKYHPANALFQEEGSAPYLADYVLLAVASEWVSKPDLYRGLFPEVEFEAKAEEIPVLFDRLRSHGVHLI